MSKIKSTPWDGKTPSIYAHLKIDGAFLRVIKTSDGEVSCLSSLDTDLTEQISNCKPKWLLNLVKNMPLNSSVLGELYYYDVENNCGCPASFIKTGLAEGINYSNEESYLVDKRSLGNNRKVKAIEYKHQLCFAAFALEYGFEKISATSPLEEVQVAVLKLGVPFAPYINIVRKLERHVTVDREFILGPLLQDFAANMRRHNVKGIAEGVMLKGGNLTGWKKVKKENTIDCFIIGYIPGKGKYSGKVGSLRCAVYNNVGDIIEIASAGGFNDEIRDYLTEQFNDEELKAELLKQVIEIKYQTVLTKGRLRHGRFFNWRDDKLKEECLTDQDIELSAYWDR